MNIEERTRLVAFHEAEVARLQGEVRAGNFDAVAPYAVAMLKQMQFHTSDKDLEAIDTPPAPQVQCDKEYILFLEARSNRLKSAIQEACYWLDCQSPGRAMETLNQALTA